MNNQELIQKADLALSDLATAGKLNDDQTDRFIRKLMDTPTMLQNCRTVTMNSPQRKINKIGFGSRMLRAGVQGVPLAEAQRYKADLSQIVMNTDEVVAEINLPYDVLEDNIERAGTDAALQGGPGGLHQTLVDMMAERAAVDLEELGLLGDTASSDPYLALTNGWLKLANANVVNAANSTISKDILKAGVKAMPDKYLRNRAQMIQYMSVDNETELRDLYSNRATALGDSMLTGAQDVFMHGSKVRGASRMPTTSGLYCDPLNLLFGIWRNIQIEYDKDIRARTFVIVLTARVGFNIEEPDAVVQYQNIKA